MYLGRRYPIPLISDIPFERPLRPSKTYKYNSGLSNQLFFLVNGIVRGAQEGRDIFLVDCFGCCIHSGLVAYASEILDFSAMERALAAEIGRPVYLLDRTAIPVFLSATQNGLDVTSKVLHRNPLDLHSLLILRYRLEDREFIDEVPVGCAVHRNSAGELPAFGLAPKIFPKLAPSAWDCQKFERLLRCVAFHPRLVAAAELLAGELGIGRHTSLIHLRAEPEAVVWWGRMNSLPTVSFLAALRKKYYTLVSQYLPPDTFTFVLCGDPVEVTELSQQFPEREFIFVSPTQKEELVGPGRELAAIIDLLLGEKCGGVLLGSGGSTFSQILRQRRRAHIPETGPDVCFNLNNIHEPETVEP